MTTDVLELDLEQRRREIDAALTRHLPDDAPESRELVAAMRYTLLAGGKRLRPLVVCASHHACGASPDEDLWRTTSAVECLHAFSLVHDDLPCMDDDDLRRGLPTLHKKYGEGMAVLAGDALAVRAFELLGLTGRPALVIELARAVGMGGMIAGQVADLQAEGREVSLDEVRTIHRCKTAALFRACALAGGLLADADSSTLESLAAYGENLGMAFQIVDDLLDVEGDTGLMGKQAGADQRRGKATYPGAAGIEPARAAARLAADRAREHVRGLPHAEPLQHILERAVRRRT